MRLGPKAITGLGRPSALRPYDPPKGVGVPAGYAALKYNNGGGYLPLLYNSGGGVYRLLAYKKES